MVTPENTLNSDPKDPHDAAFFEQMRGCRDNYRKLADAIHATVGAQSSCLDIGCGIGLQTARLKELGWEGTLGAEFSPFAIEMMEPGVEVVPFDLTKPVGEAGTLRSFACVICTETGEHISAEHALAIARNVAERATDVIVWSAAAPGQEWEGHINLQHPEYWLTRFKVFGWTLDEARTAELRGRMLSTQAQHWMGAQNFCVLVKTEAPLHFTIVSTVLNGEKWIGKHIQSVQDQTFRGYAHVIIDAASEDETFVVASDLTHTDPRVRVLCNSPERRLSSLENCWQIWKDLPDDEIIVWLDGDDWFAHDQALEVIAIAYASPREPWLTFGQFMFSDGEVGFAGPYPPGARVRFMDWRATHLKTFRAGLVKKLGGPGDYDSHVPDPVCLLQPGGQWVEHATDKAIMWPLLEMAGERYTCIYQILCVYNLVNCSARAMSPELQTELAEVERLRMMPPFQRLSERPW